MHREPDAYLHQVVGGRWRLLEVLGPTEHGVAYRAETVEDGKAARLELWDLRHVEGRGELARFEREARSLSRLRHDRCLPVIGFGAHEGRPILVSALPEGTTLRAQLGTPEMTVARALSLGLQLCEALRHLHGYGVVHRRLLPDNLWVSASSSADLLTLGLPRIGPTAESSDGKGARLYLPPGRSTAKPDHRADLYAAGMLLYVMCTGREPPAEVAAAIAGGASVPPPRAVSPERGIGEGLERVILHAVAPSADVRFGSADELLTALQSAGARATSPKRRPVQRPRNRIAILAGSLATVAVLGATALRSSGGQGPSPPPPPPVAERPTVPARPPVPPPQLAVALPAPKPEPRPEPAPKAPKPDPAPAPVVTTTSAPAAATEIWSLLDSGRLDEAATRIKQLVANDPDAAWPRFALGAFYYRKSWRRDAVRQWQQALEQSPEIRQDPQFGAYLCFMLDDTWQVAGMSDLLDRLGPKAVPLLDGCAASAKTPHLRALASRTLQRYRRTDRRSRG